MNELLKEFSCYEDEQFVSSKDCGSFSSGYVCGQFDYTTEGEIAKRRYRRIKEQQHQKEMKLNMDNLRELALLRIGEVTQFQACTDDMPKLVNGFRRTTMSKEFEKFIAEKIKEGEFPTTL